MIERAANISGASAAARLQSATGTGEAELRQAVAGVDSKEKAEVVAKQVESIFFTMMMKEMRKAAPGGGMLGKGLGGDAYLQMLDQEYAKLASNSMGLDFHDALVRQILDPKGKKADGSGAPAAPEVSQIERKEGRASDD